MLFYLLACTTVEKTSPVCSGDDVPSIELRVYNETGDLITPNEVTWTLDGVQQSMSCPGGFCFIGLEQPGEFRITVYYQSEFVTESVTVKTDECHVVTEKVDIVMPSEDDPCDNITFSNEFGRGLDFVVGCNDMNVYAFDDAQQAQGMLSFFTADLAQQALTAGESVVTYRDIGDDAFLTGALGDNLEQGACAETSSVSPTIDFSFVGISGVAEITMVPIENGNTSNGMGFASIRFFDVIMAETEVGECQIPLGEVVWEDVFVGWE